MLGGASSALLSPGRGGVSCAPGVSRALVEPPRLAALLGALPTVLAPCMPARPLPPLDHWDAAGSPALPVAKGAAKQRTAPYALLDFGFRHPAFGGASSPGSPAGLGLGPFPLPYKSLACSARCSRRSLASALFCRLSHCYCGGRLRRHRLPASPRGGSPVSWCTLYLNEISRDVTWS